MYGGGMGYGGFGGQGYNGGLPFVEEGDTHHQHAKRQRTETGAAAASGNDREGQDPERTVRRCPATRVLRKDCFAPHGPQSPSSRPTARA